MQYWSLEVITGSCDIYRAKRRKKKRRTHDSAKDYLRDA